MVLLLLACTGDVAPPPPTGGNTVEGDCGPGVTWNGFGQGFLLTYCTACHASTVSGSARKGAPDGVDFDTLAGTQDWSERVVERAIELGDMPPAGGPTADERALLENWIACGLPGDEHPLPAGSPPTDLLIGYNLRLELSDESGKISVARIIEAPSPDGRVGLLRTDTYTVDATTAQYHGHETYDADGSLISAVSWSPPLELLGISGAQAVAADWITAEDAGTDDQSWEALVLDDPDLDGHTIDPDAWGLVLTEAGGDEHGWLLSDTEGIVGRWVLDSDRLLEFQQVTADSPGSPSTEFPLDLSMPWIETMLIVEVAP